MRSNATVDVDVEERVCLGDGDGDGDAHVMSDAPLDAFERSLSGMMMTVSSDLYAFI